MQLGIVQWYNADKGYGVARTPEGEEFFLHSSALRSNGEAPIVTDMAVAFEGITDAKKNRKTGKNWRPVTNPALWTAVCDYLDKPAFVEMQGRSGSVSILDKGITQILKGQSVVRAIHIAKEHYDQALSDASFISYCEALERCFQRVWLTDPSQFQEATKTIFNYFGENLRSEIVFRAWKEKKFRFIGRTGIDDLEIPEQVLTQFKDELELPEFVRINHYSYGPAFTKPFVEAQLQTASQVPLADFANLYAWADLEDKQECQVRKDWLDGILLERKRLLFEDKLQNLPEITASNFWKEYQQAQELWLGTDQAHSAEVQKAIANALLEKADSPKTQVRIWLADIPSIELTDELLKGVFISADFGRTEHVQMLQKLDEQKQQALLLALAADQGTLVGFETLQALVAKLGSASGSDFKENVSNEAYWAGVNHGSMIQATLQQLFKNVSSEDIYPLFEAGYLADIPEALLDWHLPDYNATQLEKLCEARKDAPTQLLHLLTKKLDHPNSEIITSGDLYRIAKEHLAGEAFDQFDVAAYNTLEKEDFLNLWEFGKARLFPEKYISELLGSDKAEYEKVKGWVRIGRATSQQVSKLLFDYLKSHSPIDDRLVFEKVRHQIQLLLHLDESSHLAGIKALENDFYDLLLWHLEKDVPLDFELLRGKFIYFHPKEQASILRRLFYLKEKGELPISLTQLATLTRFDLSLYREVAAVHSELELDISTDVVLQALLHFKKDGKFLMTGDLLKVALQDLRGLTKKTTQLEHYFEKCKGRAELSFTTHEDRNIRKVPFGEGQFYYSISFHYNESLVEAVKSIPGRRWNQHDSVWGVPSKHEAEVFQFAEKYEFFFDLEDKRGYTNNKHLFSIEREKVPAGIKYCEGRLAHIPDAFHNRKFWWCANQKCFQNCETHHRPEAWREYTLLDFCRILGFNLDDVSVVGEPAKNGYYYKFISLINRFNRLWEKLYCTACDQVMYPADVSHFAAYTVVRFRCVTADCKECGKDVYLNHCLNGKCNHIIDSRVSKRCGNGLLICANCGSCCSHAMLTRRLNSLRKTGGYIHQNLIYCVEHKLGHLERGEYFCYEHMLPMVEEKEDYFKCPDCNIFYNTKSYKIKRPHKGLSKDIRFIDSANPEQLPDDFMPGIEE